MQRYNYYEAMEEDILTWLEDEGKTLEDYKDAQELRDALWTEDRVTGNGSGSHTFDSWEAKENLCHNWDLLAKAAKEFGYEVVDLNKGAEFWDVVIRCYLLESVCEKIFDDKEAMK